MSLEYIRKTYGVPAKRGGIIEYTGHARKLLSEDRWKITGALDARLRVVSVTTGRKASMHPTWCIRYLPDGPEFGRDDGDN